MPAFQEALDAGADFFELDVQMSGDDEVIVFHDPVISNRVCRNGDGSTIAKPIPLRALNTAQIRTFDCGNTHIPTLAEALEWVSKVSPPIGVNIEIKTDVPDVAPEDFAKRVLALVDKYRLRDRVIIQSFDFRPLRTVKELASDIRLACLFDKRADFSALTKSVGASGCGPQFKWVTNDVVKACHSNGIKVIPWTVNESEDWERLIALGVDGIITDYPRKLKRQIDSAIDNPE